MDAGKSVLIYSSSQPVELGSVDRDEYDRLVEWREGIRDRALYDTFSDAGDLVNKLFAALTRVVRERFDAAEPAPGESRVAGRRAAPIAVVDTEREMRRVSKSGKPQYTTRHTLVIQNHGSAVAEDFECHLEHVAGSEEGENAIPTVMERDRVSRFAPASPLRYPMLVHMGTARQVEIVMKWREGEEWFETTQTIRV